jgi:hypothetical protein
MAGNLAAFTKHLTNTLALPANVTDAVVQQGYALFDNMDYLEDDDIDRLCMAIRRPGGQITTAAGVQRNDPGVAIGQMHQSRLKQLAYYIKYTCLLSNTFTAAQATLARLPAAYAYKKTADQKVKNGNPDMPETFTTAKKARDHLENMNSWIAESFGIGDLPLDYVVRDEVNPPVDADDPGHASPTYKDELIRRAADLRCMVVL